MAFNDAEMKIILRAQDQASSVLEKVERQSASLGRALHQLDRITNVVGRGFNKFHAVLQGFGLGIGSSVFYTFERMLGRIGGLLPDLIERGEQWGDALDRIQDSTGMSAEAAFQLAAAAKFVGTSVDTLGMSLARFARNAIDNADAFHRFGVEIVYLNDGSVDVAATLTNVRRVMSDTGQSAEVTAGLMALLGRAGFEAADLLTLTDQQLRLITEDARASGLAMSQAQIDMQQELRRTRNHLDMALTGLGTQIMLGVAPALTSLIEGIAKAIQDNMDAIVRFAVQVVNFIAGLISGLFGINLATISLAGSVGALAGGTRALGDTMPDLANRANKAASGEDALTRSLNRQIDAIDRQLSAMDKRERAHDAARERQQLVGDIEEMRQQLEDLKTQGVFTAGMSEAEAELARQKHAADILDAQGQVNDAQERLREHDRDEAARLRRDELEAERAWLQKRLQQHTKFLRDLATQQRIHLPKLGLPGVSDDDRGGGVTAMGAGLTGAITQAAADARAAGLAMAANVKTFVDKVGEFAMWAKGIIDTLGARPLGPGTPSILEAGIGIYITRAILGVFGVGGAAGTGVGVASTLGPALAALATSAVGAAAGLAAIPFLVGGDTAPGQTGTAGVPPGTYWDANLGMWVNGNLPKVNTPAVRDPATYYSPGLAQPVSTQVNDPQLTALQNIERAVGPGGAFFQQLYNQTSDAGRTAEAAEGTADAATRTAASTAGTESKLGAGINTSVTNTPTVNAATGFTIKGITTKVDVSNPALSALRFKNGKLSTTTLTGTQPPGCFVAGTMVSTPSGEIAIEAIAIGDAVLAVDVENGLEVVPSIVTAVHRHPANPERRVRVTLTDGRVITATEGHRFFNPVRGDFYPLATFEPGFLVHDAELGAVEIASMKWLTGKADVYNLTVAIHQNYLVEGILVHNIKPTYAQGGLFDTLGRMEMVVGEAERETVAVLKHPQRMSAGAFGAGNATYHFHLEIEGRQIAEYITNWQQMNVGRSTTLRPGGR